MLETGRGLLLRPRLLLLEQPTMGLAPLVMDLIFDKILEVHHQGGQAHGGLVEEQEPGPEQEPAPDLEHASLATAQAFGALAPSFGEPRKQREHTLDVGAYFVRRLPDVRSQLEVFLDRHLGEETRSLHDVGDALAQKRRRAQAADRFTVERDRSLTRRQEAGDGLERSEEHTSELQSLRHLVCRL